MDELNQDDPMYRARTWFKESAEAFDDVRDEARDDLRMYTGNQWPDEIRSVRELDNRPILTFNRLSGYVDQVMGEFRKNRPRMKAIPVGMDDGQSAAMMDSLLEYIQRNSKANVAYDRAAEGLLSCSMGYFRIDVDYTRPDSFEQDIYIKPIHNHMSVYMDPAAKEADRSDARYCFVTEMIPKEEFEARYPDADVTGSDLLDMGLDDKQYWITEDEVRIAEFWEREPVKRTMIQMSGGGVYFAEEIEGDEALIQALQGQSVVAEREVDWFKVIHRIISGSEVLEEKEWAGAYIPIVPALGMEEVIDGRRSIRSLIRMAKDPQRMYNFWRTSEAEVVALQPKAPYLATQTQVEGYEDMWEEANTRQFPYILYNPDPAAGGKPQRETPPNVSAGIMAAAQGCIDEMKATTGLYDANLGDQQTRIESGVAIKALQKSGDTSTFPFIDNFSRALEYAGTVILDLIPKVYKAHRLLRITGADGQDRMIEINKPIIDGLTGMTMVMNDVNTGRYDIEIDTGPSHETARAEAAAGMLEFMNVVPQIAPQIADLVAGTMDWEGAEQLAQRIRMLLPPGVDQQEDPRLMQATQQVQQLQGMVHALTQQLQDKQGELQLKSQEIQIKGYEAQIKDKEANVKAAEAQADRENDQRKVLGSIEEARIKRMTDAEKAVYEGRIETLTKMVEALQQQQAAQVGPLMPTPSEPVHLEVNVDANKPTGPGCKKIRIQKQGDTWTGIAEDGME